MATAADLTAEASRRRWLASPGSRHDRRVSARLAVRDRSQLVRRYHRRGRVELATCHRLGIQLDHDPDELAEIESQIDAAIQTSELAQALNTLPDTQRQALQLRGFEEMDYSADDPPLPSTAPVARSRYPGPCRQHHWGGRDCHRSGARRRGDDQHPAGVCPDSPFPRVGVAQDQPHDVARRREPQARRDGD